MNRGIILLVPGLNDHEFFHWHLTNLLPGLWKRWGYDLRIIRPNWNHGKTFAPKLKRILDEIDTCTSKNTKIILMGVSAGGSAALNAFALRKDKVEKVVNVNGRVRSGENVFLSLELAAILSPAFKESVLLFENRYEKKLLKQDRKKILIVHPILDEIVPVSTAILADVQTYIAPVVGHVIGGMCTLTIFSGRLRQFIEK